MHGLNRQTSLAPFHRTIFQPTTHAAPKKISLKLLPFHKMTFQLGSKFLIKVHVTDKYYNFYDKYSCSEKSYYCKNP
jgi:hypothetical protein